MTPFNTGKVAIPRPPFVHDAHLEFLDDLRKSGVTNMYGAVPYLLQEFDGLDRKLASAILWYWIKTFSTRHPITDKEKS